MITFCHHCYLIFQLIFALNHHSGAFFFFLLAILPTKCKDFLEAFYSLFSNVVKNERTLFISFETPVQHLEKM